MRVLVSSHTQDLYGITKERVEASKLALPLSEAPVEADYVVYITPDDIEGAANADSVRARMSRLGVPDEYLDTLDVIAGYDDEILGHGVRKLVFEIMADALSDPVPFYSRAVTFGAANEKRIAFVVLPGQDATALDFFSKYSGYAKESIVKANLPWTTGEARKFFRDHETLHVYQDLLAADQSGISRVRSQCMRRAFEVAADLYGARDQNTGFRRSLEGMRALGLGSFRDRRFATNTADLVNDPSWFNGRLVEATCGERIYDPVQATVLNAMGCDTPDDALLLAVQEPRRFYDAAVRVLQAGVYERGSYQDEYVREFVHYAQTHLDLNNMKLTRYIEPLENELVQEGRNVSFCPPARP